jgi:serine/threonine protein kinase
MHLYINCPIIIKDFVDMFPGASSSALNLLRLMLLFNPHSRVTVDEALNHPFFGDIRNPAVEFIAEKPMSPDLEFIGESSENLKQNVNSK